MFIMAAVVSAIAVFYHGSVDITNPHHREIIAYRLTSKMPILAAMYYTFTNSRNDLDYASNFLHMMLANPCETNPVLTKVMDKIFILHPDHEQNDPTSTVRFNGSTGANSFACIIIGIAAF
jgi:citrate synthase